MGPVDLIRKQATSTCPTLWVTLPRILKPIIEKESVFAKQKTNKKLNKNPDKEKKKLNTLPNKTAESNTLRRLTRKPYPGPKIKKTARVREFASPSLIPGTGKGIGIRNSTYEKISASAVKTPIKTIFCVFLSISSLPHQYSMNHRIYIYPDDEANKLCVYMNLK